MGMKSLNLNGLKGFRLLGFSKVKALTPYPKLELGVGWADS